MDLLSLSGVAKRYASGTEAVADIGFAQREGGFTALLGPSGCGKSTLLRMIAGLVAPSAGSIAWSDPDAARDIGFVFQDATLMPWARARANVALPLRLRGVARGEAGARADAALAAVGLAGFERSFPRMLSGGMRMRVSIARALVAAPRVLLMDEPFAALDEITRFRLNDDLLALWAARRFTALFVTHSVFESVYLAERVLVMTPRPGRIAADIALPPHPRPAGFRSSAEYAALCGQVAEALRAAMPAADTVAG